jgi:hypothetical protein
MTHPEKFLKAGMTRPRLDGDDHWLDKAKPVYGEEMVEDTKTTLRVLKVFL